MGGLMGTLGCVVPTTTRRIDGLISTIDGMMAPDGPRRRVLVTNDSLFFGSWRSRFKPKRFQSQ